MSLTSRGVRSEVENLLSYVMDNEIAVYANPVRDYGGRITWQASGGPFLGNRRRSGLSDYRDWVGSSQYSAILNDGSLLQITYDIGGGILIGHRLAYVPCPLPLEAAMLREEPMLDVIETYSECGLDELRLGGMIRFDYDPDNQAAGHPAAHLTLNSAHCRIACAGPLRLGRFVEFVFKHFYPETWGAHPFLGRLAGSGWAGRTVTSEERDELHVSWRLE